MYVQGWGVPEDDILAHMWLNIAAAQEEPGATTERARVAERLSNDEIVRAQRLAVEWLEDHPTLGE
jgi:hypothetical protein